MADRVPFFWFHFEDIDDARAVTRRAGYAGAFTATLSAAVVLYTLASPGSPFSALVDGWSLAEVGLIAGLSYGTWRGNRFAATGLLALYVVGQILTRIAAGSAGGLILSGFFVVLFVQGMLGAFALHRLRPDGDLDGALSALEHGPDEAAGR